MRQYVRDGRSPIPRSESTSRVMSANKGKDTGPERALRKALRAKGITGYRLDWRKAPGRPDIAFPGRMVAIFVHGCFWHRCPRCKLPLPQSNKGFWEAKFRRNQERDAIKVQELEAIGWRALIVWECEVKGGVDEVVSRISESLR